MVGGLGLAAAREPRAARASPFFRAMYFLPGRHQLGRRRAAVEVAAQPERRRRQLGCSATVGIDGPGWWTSTALGDAVGHPRLGVEGPRLRHGHPARRAAGDPREPLRGGHASTAPARGGGCAASPSRCSRRRCSSCVVISLINGFQVFDQVWVMTEGGPAGASDGRGRADRQEHLLATAGPATPSAQSVVLFVIILVVTVVQLRAAEAVGVLWLSPDVRRAAGSCATSCCVLVRRGADRAVRVDGADVAEDRRRHQDAAADAVIPNPITGDNYQRVVDAFPFWRFAAQQPRRRGRLDRCCSWSPASTRRLRLRPHRVPRPQPAVRAVPRHDDDPAAGDHRAAVHRDAEPRPRRHLRRRCCCRPSCPRSACSCCARPSLALPKELDEAAFIDGAGHFRVFARILLPLIGPALATFAVFAFMASGTRSSGRSSSPRHPTATSPCPSGCRGCSGRFTHRLERGHGRLGDVDRPDRRLLPAHPAMGDPQRRLHRAQGLSRRPVRPTTTPPHHQQPQEGSIDP